MKFARRLPTLLLATSTVLGVVVTPGSAKSQQKGGLDETGPYDVIENWLETVEAGWYHHVTGVFAQSPDRIFRDGLGSDAHRPTACRWRTAAPATTGLRPRAAGGQERSLPDRGRWGWQEDRRVEARPRPPGPAACGPDQSVRPRWARLDHRPRWPSDRQVLERWSTGGDDAWREGRPRNRRAALQQAGRHGPSCRTDPFWSLTATRTPGSSNSTRMVIS